MVKAKIFKVVKHFKEFPESSDLELVEEELPPLKDGEFLVEALYLSVDPYMKYGSHLIPIGSTMMGEQVGTILESKNPIFPIGRLVAGTFGWRTHTVSDGQVRGFNMFHNTPHLVPEFGSMSPSHSLGVVGMPGITAYFGLLTITRPKPGETLVVSTASGAVGSIVGQIGKIKGCKVIGIAGSDHKGTWMTTELRFDHFINYKTQDVDKELKKVAPEGVDCYYDNVGGKITATVQKHMNHGGRITIVGLISKYNEKPLKDESLDSFLILSRELKVEGFVVNSVLDRWDEGINQLYQWIKEGKLKYKETITEGFENSLNALVSLLKGHNIGKAIVKI